MTNLRLIAWNCHHGTLNERVALLQPHKPDVVFLQECRPGTELPLHGDFLNLTINVRKGIALGSLNPNYRLAQLAERPPAGQAVIAAQVSGLVSFTLLGIWSHGTGAKDYVDDVRRSLDAYGDVLRSTPTVVFGDFNSGPKMDVLSSLSKDHSRLLAAFDALGMVSAYHVFHGVDHGREKHPTYRHKPQSSEPWHIDFCFVPNDWANSITHVELLDSELWRAESDHHPLMVELRFV
jgi:exonuclease III